MSSLLRNNYGLLAILPCILELATAVNLKPDNASFCPGSTARFTCNTTMGSLLWETSSTTVNHIFNNPAQSSITLDIFRLHLDGISQTSGTVKAVNSTAVVSDVLLSYDGILLKCSEYADLSMFSETILRVKGPPPVPAVNPITVVDEGSINSTLLISWSQSNCAVQYVVTIINSSDDRVYPNITTSNTGTTVTLPTGVEFCVTLEAVDSIGRRRPDTKPVCYQFPSEVSTATATDTITILTNGKATTLIDTLTLTTSPAVTHSPMIMGGVNVAAAVAIPVVLVLLLVIGVVVVGLSYYLHYHKRQGQASFDNPLQRTKRVQVFSREKDINIWKIEYVTCWKKDNRSVKEDFENSGYTAHGEPVDVQVTSDEETIPVTVQSVTTGWSVEQLQESKAEVEDHVTDENKPLCTTTTFIVSSSQTSPEYDMCVSVNIDGGQTPAHTVTVERKASRRCVCQVFYHWKGLNCWMITFAFFPEHLLDKVLKLYPPRNILIGPKVNFCLCYEASDIDLSTNCKTSMWHIVKGSKSPQVSRAAVEGYTGKGEPPCIVMTLKPKSDKTKPLTLPVTLTGVREPNNMIEIERTAEDPTGCVCQVFYYKEDSNIWTVTLAFCQKNKFDKMKEFYQNADIGPAIDIDFILTSHIAPNIRKVIGGWTLVHDNQLKQVNRAAVEGYTGEGEPPCIVMTLNAANKTVSIDANFTVILNGVQPPNTITITRSPDVANFQTESSNDVNDRISRSYADIEVHEAERDSDTESEEFSMHSNSRPSFMK